MNFVISTQFFGQLQQAYTRHDTKIITIIMVLLVLYLLSALAKITWQLVPVDASSQVQTTYSTPDSPDMATSGTKTNLSGLLNLNLFGTVDVAPTVQVQQSITEAPETKLNLLLAGVVASSEQEKGAAVIAYRNAQATYGIGDQVEGTQVTVEEIYHDRVIIKNRATRETLMLDGIDFDEANRRLEQAPQRSTQMPPEPQIPSPNDVREIRQQLQEKPESFADFINMTPEQGELGIIGFRLSPGKNPAFFTSLGLRAGDVVTELNGLDLSDIQQAAEAASALQTEEELVLEILRDGQAMSLVIEIPRE